MSMTNEELSKAIEATLKGVAGFGSGHPTYVASLSHLKALHLEQLKRACHRSQPTGLLNSDQDQYGVKSVCHNPRRKANEAI